MVDKTVISRENCKRPSKSRCFNNSYIIQELHFFARNLYQNTHSCRPPRCQGTWHACHQVWKILDSDDPFYDQNKEYKIFYYCRFTMTTEAKNGWLGIRKMYSVEETCFQILCIAVSEHLTTSIQGGLVVYILSLILM